MKRFKNKTEVVLAAGYRTPFQKPGSGYRHLSSSGLARWLISDMINRIPVDAGHIEAIQFGTTLPEPSCHNLARRAALEAGLPEKIPANTVSMSCLSSHKAITSGAEQILSGSAGVVLAGGTDVFSTLIPFFRNAPEVQSQSRVSARVPQKALPSPWVSFLRETFKKAVSLEDFWGLTKMGMEADRLASQFDINRESQDAFAVRSHQRALKAQGDGVMEDELIPMATPPDFEPVLSDNGFSAGYTPEFLSKLKPAFTPNYGTVTSGNSCTYSDGAAALLMMSNHKAAEFGCRPLAKINSWVYTASHPEKEPLNGAIYAISSLLTENKLTLKDIDVFEIHEPFSSQVLATLKAISSGFPLQEEKSKNQPIPFHLINVHGGTLALGHPVAATGARLVITAAHRLVREKGKFALAATASGDGMGHAILLEAIDAK